MIDWWKNRTTLKRAKEMVHGTRKLIRMHRDILDPRDVQNVTAAADSLAGAVKTKNTAGLNGLAEKLDKQIEKAMPRQPYAALRENVEVFLVAAIVAMAVRTFIIQPFKIPTGSMQPTLFGIYPPEQMAPTPYTDGHRPSFPAMLFGTVFDGKIYNADGYRSRGDHIFVDRLTYHFRKPQRGEVIDFTWLALLLRSTVLTSVPWYLPLAFPVLSLISNRP